MQQIALVVDDSRVARMTLSKLLVAHGLEVIELGSGEDALVYLQNDNVKPDIIFMDVMMGGMDGLAATQKIKADINLNHIPIVVCTGHETDSDNGKALAVGAVATLTKPPKADELDALIADLAQHIASAREGAVSGVDTVALLAEIMATIEQDFLPIMQQELKDIVESVSRQVASDTAEQRIAEQVSLLAQNAPEPVVAIDENALMANIINSVEHDFLPKIHNDIREIAEDVSRQTANDAVEQRIAEQVSLSAQNAPEPVDENTLFANVVNTVEHDLLPKIHKDIREMTEDISRQVAISAVEEIVLEKVQVAVDGLLPASAQKAVQNEMSEFDIAGKIQTMLNSEGEIWLQRHEQLIFEQLQGQIEDKFAPLVMKYLNDHLEQMITPIAHTVVEKALANDEALAEINTEIELQEDPVDELKQQISTLKTAVMGLGFMVVLLAAAMII